MVLTTDYTEEHPSLGGEETLGTNSQSGVDTKIIEKLIGTVDSTIENTLNSGGTNTSTNTQIDTPLDTQIDNTNSDGQDNLDTYQPQKPSSYNPTVSNLDAQQKTLVSDRMFNNLGIKPDLVVSKGEKYFVERSYQ